MRLPAFLNNKDINSNTAQFGAFAVYLFNFGMNQKNKGNQYNTIKGKISAIRWYHRFYTGVIPELDEGYKLLMKGFRRMSEPIKKKRPVTAMMLRWLSGLMDWSQPQHHLAWGSILLAYFFMLRRSEFLKVDGRWMYFVLRLGDTKFYDQNENVCNFDNAHMVGIVLRGAKNNQYGREDVRFQFKTGDPVLCPVLALACIHRAATHFKTKPHEPLTAMGAGRGLSNIHVTNILKTLASDMGLATDGYSTHSLRIGGSTSLLNGGAPPLVIKLLGQWLSNCFESYPVLQSAGTKGISNLMC